MKRIAALAIGLNLMLLFDCGNASASVFGLTLDSALSIAVVPEELWSFVWPMRDNGWTITVVLPDAGFDQPGAPICISPFLPPTTEATSDGAT